MHHKLHHRFGSFFQTLIGCQPTLQNHGVLWKCEQLGWNALHHESCIHSCRAAYFASRFGALVSGNRRCERFDARPSKSFGLCKQSSATSRAWWLWQSLWRFASSSKIARYFWDKWTTSHYQWGYTWELVSWSKFHSSHPTCDRYRGTPLSISTRGWDGSLQTLGTLIERHGKRFLRFTDARLITLSFWGKGKPDTTVFPCTWKIAFILQFWWVLRFVFQILFLFLLCLTYELSFLTPPMRPCLSEPLVSLKSSSLPGVLCWVVGFVATGCHCKPWYFFIHLCNQNLPNLRRYVVDTSCRVRFCVFFWAFSKTFHCFASFDGLSKARSGELAPWCGDLSQNSARAVHGCGVSNFIWQKMKNNKKNTDYPRVSKSSDFPMFNFEVVRGFASNLEVLQGFPAANLSICKKLGQAEKQQWESQAQDRLVFLFFCFWFFFGGDGEVLGAPNLTKAADVSGAERWDTWFAETPGELGGPKMRKTRKTNCLSLWVSQGSPPEARREARGVAKTSHEFMWDLEFLQASWCRATCLEQVRSVWHSRSSTFHSNVFEEFCIFLIFCGFAVLLVFESPPISWNQGLVLISGSRCVRPSAKWRVS